MKLQISFDFLDLEKAINIANEVAPFADILEIGSVLIYIHGINAIKRFQQSFVGKEIFADIKLIDRVEPIIKEYSKVGANIISVMAGTTNNIIQNATKVAHENKSLIALDLADANSMGQSAMDSQILDVDRIIFHGPHESNNLEKSLEEWENVTGNTKTPIFIAGGINKENIAKIIELKPAGIIIGSAITESNNPAKMAEEFKKLL
ncbi:MAG: orotidine 5'-phosphate decarboxylase / HUMPS family protein [bacterium]